jgi:integrase/recombinase XerD
MRRTKTGPAKTLTETQFRNLLVLVESGNHPLRNKTILLISHLLGLRASEIASLKIADVVDASGKVKSELSLVAAYTKGNKHRDIPLKNEKVRKALMDWVDYRKSSDVIFNQQSSLFISQKGLPFSANSMTRMINGLYQKYGFEGCSSHTGRRTMITKLANSGVDVNSIRVIAGHQSISTTQRYIEHNPDTLAQIMKSL